MTLATSIDDQPYCANLFYAWSAAAESFVFTSGHTTRHGREALANQRVAASVVLETRVVGRVQGLQIMGEIIPVDLDSESGKEVRATYMKRFPYAAVAELHLWTLKPDFLKLTDNTLGFGKKLIWNRNETSE